MAQTVQTAVETLYGSSDFAVFFDDTLINDLVISFSTNNYVNGIASSANINCIYSEAFYKIKNYDANGDLIKEMHGIDYMTNVKIFIKNTITNLYHMVFDGNLTGKGFAKSNEGQVSLSFSAEDYMHYLDKTVVPIAVPINSTFSSSDRLKWKAQGINIETVSKYENEASRSLKNKNIKELINESIDVSISNNAFFTDKEGVTYWDAPTDRLKVMGDVSEQLRKAEIIDYIVTSDGTSVSSMYVMIGSLANSLMFEFYQDRDGVIRVKPPFWNEGVLKDHIIMPSFISSYEETTDFTKMYTRVVTQGSIDPSINAGGGVKNYLLPVGCYVAGDENQQGIWVSYTSAVDPYTQQDRVQRSVDDFINTTTNASPGSVYGTSGTPTGTGEKAWNTATESFRPLVTQVTAKWGMSPVVNILLAMIMQESSGGTGTSGSGIAANIDVMQANEGAYGEIYSSNKIKTPEDSINAGVQELKDSLTKAKGDVAIALQTYNFGPSFITYVKNNGGVYTQALALAFSNMMKKSDPKYKNGYGDPYYVPHVMQYVPAGSPTNYMPATGTASGSTTGSFTGSVLNTDAAGRAALVMNYIASSVFYNTIQRNTDISGRQMFSLPGFGSSSSGLLGRKSAFTTGNSAFNPLLWSLDSDIVDYLDKMKSTLGGAPMLGGIVGGNNGIGATVAGKCIGSASVTENIYNIGKSNLDSRQWGGIKATSGCYIDARQFSTADLLAVGRQYFGIPYKLVGADASPNRGYDCASYVASVYSHFGIRLGTYVRAIDVAAHGALGGLDVKPVAFESLAVGDLLIWPDHTHVTMYAGNGRMYAAPYSGKNVEEQSMTKEKFNQIGITAIRRPAIFKDSPGAGSYTNTGTTASAPATAVPPAPLPGSLTVPVYFDAMSSNTYSNGKSIIEQNNDLLTGNTSISGVVSGSGFLADTELSREGTVKPTDRENLAVGPPYLASSVRSSNNADTREASLLWQSNNERKYGANILNIDQPLIRGYDKFTQIMTKDGPAASISDALRSYSIFMHGLTNGLVETATLSSTAPMPWLRCGMNCWVDPMGIDKIFYINGIKHSGSAKNGVQTELSLGYGRSRYQYLNDANKFGSLQNSWRDNVFVSKIYQGFSIRAFGEVIDSKREFADFKKAIERNYEIAGKDSFAFSEPRSIDNSWIYRDLYGGHSVDTSGRDGLDIAVLNPDGQILVRTADGSIITGAEAVKRYEQSQAADRSEQAPANPSTPVDSSGSSTGGISKWADGTGYPSGVTYEDKKCLKYLAWLETMPSLRYGDSGDQVKRLQRILYYLGIVIMDANGIDGYFGPITRRGVQAVQNSFGISQTGVLTSKEIDKLKAMLQKLLNSAAKSAYVSAVGSSTTSPTTSASGQPVLDSLTTKESPLTGPIYYKSGDLYDYSYAKKGRSTKRMLLGAYSLTVIKHNLELNYSQGNSMIISRRDNVRKTFQRAMNEIETRSPMMKFKPN